MPVSTVSTTDIKLFVAGANPELANLSLPLDDIAASMPRRVVAAASVPDGSDAQTATDGEESDASGDGETSVSGSEATKERSRSGSGQSSSASSRSSSSSDHRQRAARSRRSSRVSHVTPAPRAGGVRSEVSVARSTAASTTSFADLVSQHRQRQGQLAGGAPMAPPTDVQAMLAPARDPWPAAPAAPAAWPAATPAWPRPVEPRWQKPPEESEELLLEKQSVLHELRNMVRDHNVQLSKEYTLADRLEDMRFEMRRHLLDMEERDTVELMRDGMRMVFAGIEIANHQLGPFLDLDGWAASVGSTLHKYDSSLSRLYRKYWKRSNTSPEMHIAFGVLGSLGMYHFRKSGMLQGVAGGVMGGMMGGGAKKSGATSRPSARNAPPPAARAESSDDEGLPDSFK